MHSSGNAICDRSPRTPFKRANHFSFPPTQRKGLLDPTSPARSSDQQENLEWSYRKMLFALNMAPM